MIDSLIFLSTTLQTLGEEALCLSLINIVSSVYFIDPRMCLVFNKCLQMNEYIH